ncbi:MULTISPECIES: tRNA (adenosine(37)-N6)-threonylcarbamoyltransferase complex dimerization subunit type 1 TsaB [unclassified Granulicatella]|uniref:tRNA (adenosine(37)-N6)-threonylcarbamoyltransferase complex dimerization subunit type 1 TsaB n=1 Tax=unclassified Granulicatella TaxID=2630493 RepID=UPI0010737891|nr:MULTISPECIES: tRNA (adenosine(37)-N6)-threonylcarbamoyltransferase complex dimerization subunit type 1 TsaB [unclassified Granulicatella]MBF0779641.1 tRNA (adenosine(37)-N6)-threonylcarbamoyltransferase complex dimerization subunit type 1 TsaB [Granulicatella sp. 19428wC4_WM01]TFU96299.1 tRNA (adenosine(37)-N6)-threonylcarbamoyltransferase complex dimerization subunit type 1 TsaB [Granulicatella sp. WM01]
MYTLIIEASNKALSVAVFHQDVCLEHHVQYDTLQHSIHLAPAVDTVLHKAHLDVKQINRIIVSNGPGSYTGLRIGVTFAKTLAYALNIPLYAVSSLAALAQGSIGQKDTLIVPFFDARRQHVYAGMYCNGEAKVQDSYLSFEALLERVCAYSKPILFVSPDIDVYETVLQHYIAQMASKHIRYVKAYPEAKYMLPLMHTVQPTDVHVLTPFYLNKVEAEVNWEKQNGQLQKDDILVERVAWGK